MRRHHTATTLVVALIALSGCGGDDNPAAEPDADPTSDGTTSPAAPTEPPPVATGPEVRLEAVTYRLPQGWDRPSYSFGRSLASSHDPESRHTVTSVYTGDIVTDDAPVDDFVRTAIKTARELDPDVTRLPNILVDDIEVYRLESHLNYGGSKVHSIEYGTGEGPYITSIVIETWTDYLTKKEERLIHESILNTVDWQF